MHSLVSITQEIVYRTDYGSIVDKVVMVCLSLLALCFAYFFFRQLYRCVCYVVRWYHDGDELRAKNMISEFDNYEDIDNVVVEVPASTLKLRLTKMRKIAFAMAYRAYFQFGYRPQSEANVLITRKFLRDALGDLKDMRFKDMNVIIDIALPLSFLPSLAMREMNEIRDTNEFQSRSTPIRTRSWTSWWDRSRKAVRPN